MIQDTGMTETPLTLSAATKTEDGNSACKGGKLPWDYSVVAPLDDLAKLEKQVVSATVPDSIATKTYSS